ncbi:pilin [Patescibacteria group bacterium]|nr:pilin [Patescibacteria group bacterium]MBU1672928.1 pilin [Patescibacteria group bacterium]MBU1963346.1 pilin [Patescibacteria group bacterium]
MDITKIRSYVTIGVIVLMALFAVGNFALAVDVDVTPDAATNIGLGEASPEDIVVNIINWILGILALIAVIMILVGGFKWMTAGGNEEKVEGAKKLLIAAVIGLVIILAAWGISVYAIDRLLNITNDAP